MFRNELALCVAREFKWGKEHKLVLVRYTHSILLLNVKFGFVLVDHINWIRFLSKISVWKYRIVVQIIRLGVCVNYQ